MSDDNTELYSVYELYKAHALLFLEFLVRNSEVIKKNNDVHHAIAPLIGRLHIALDEFIKIFGDGE